MSPEEFDAWFKPIDELGQHRNLVRFHLTWAVLCGAMGLIVAPWTMELSVASILAGGLHAYCAALASRRVDAILQRSLAASLLEEGPAVLSEAA